MLNPQLERSFMQLLFTLLTAMVFVTCPAHALTDAEVKQVVDSLPAVQKLGQKLEASGQFEGLQAEMNVMLEGSFAPFAQSIKLMQTKAPAAYSEMETLITSFGFASPAKWGELSDKVLNAYMALKIEDENVNALAMAEQMTPEMMEQIPPGLREQMEASLKVMRQLNQVPVVHKEAVLPYLDQLDQWSNHP